MIRVSSRTTTVLVTARMNGECVGAQDRGRHEGGAVSLPEVGVAR
jgi:hypothetical protein